MTKSNFGNQSGHEKIYYTQEGSPYLLRGATRTIPVLTPATFDTFMGVIFNPQNSSTNWNTLSPNGFIEIENANKPIVPISFNYQVVHSNILLPGTAFTLANLQLPYYMIQYKFDPTGLQGLNWNNLKALSKMTPLINIIEADPVTGTLVYGVRYDAVSLANDDFIEIQGSAACLFQQSAANAFTGKPVAFHIADPTPGFTTIVMTCTYFELQADKR